MDQEKRAELERLARPLVQWINNNCHPHTEINVNHHRVEILEGSCCILIPDYLKN